MCCYYSLLTIKAIRFQNHLLIHSIFINFTLFRKSRQKSNRLAYFVVIKNGNLDGAILLLPQPD